MERAQQLPSIQITGESEGGFSEAGSKGQTQVVFTMRLQDHICNVSVEERLCNIILSLGWIHKVIMMYQCDPAAGSTALIHPILPPATNSEPMSAGDRRATFIREWISSVDADVKTEQIREGESSLIAKEKKLGNKSLEFADCLVSLASGESTGLRQCLLQVAESFRTIETDRTKALQHLERIVFQRLDGFRALLKDHKDILNRQNVSTDKAKAAEKVIEKLTNKAQCDELKIVQSKQQLLACQVELQRDDDALSTGTIHLDTIRIDLIQDSLARLVNSYIYFHSKALENMTGLVSLIAGIDNDKEKQVLTSTLLAFAESARLETPDE